MGGTGENSENRQRKRKKDDEKDSRQCKTFISRVASLTQHETMGSFGKERAVGSSKLSSAFLDE